MARNCRIDTDIKDLKDVLSKEEIDGIYAKAESIVADAKAKGVNPVEALENAKKAYVEDIKSTKLRGLATQARNLELKNKILDGSSNTFEKIESLLLAPKSGKNAIGEVPMRHIKENNFSSTMAIINQQLDGIEGAEKILTTGIEDLTIRKILMGETVDASPQVRKVAEVIKASTDRSFKLKADAGFNVKYLEGRVVRQTHSAKGMMDYGKKEYISLALETFDFSDTQFTTRADQIKFISGFYKDTVEGKGAAKWQIDEEVSKITRDTGKRFEESRKIKFKNAEAAHKYNAAINKKTLFAQLVDEISTDSGKLAAAQTFGPNYNASFTKLINEAGLTPTQRNNLTAKMGGILEGYDTGDSSIATLGSNVRKLTDLRSLSASLITTLTDHAFTAGTLSAFSDKNVIRTSIDSVTGFFKMLPKSNRREVAEKLGLYMEDMIADAQPNRMGGEISKSTGVLNWAHRNYMKYLGLNSQSTAAKLNGAKIFSGYMAELNGRAFDTLPTGMRDLLGRYGIDSKDWSNIATAIDDVAGTRAISLAKVESTSLRTKLSAVFQTVAEWSSPTATEGHTYWKGLIDPNTVHGQVALFMGQYKSFSLASLDAMRAIKGADNTALRSWSTVGATAALSTAWGFTALALKDIAKGKEPRDITPESTMEAFLQGGTAGIFGDILMNDYDNMYESLAATTLGPSFKYMQDVIGTGHNFFDVAIAAAQGDTPEVKREAAKIIKTVVGLSPKAPLIGNAINRNLLEAIQKSTGLPVVNQGR